MIQTYCIVARGIKLDPTDESIIKNLAENHLLAVDDDQFDLYIHTNIAVIGIIDTSKSFYVDLGPVCIDKINSFTQDQDEQIHQAIEAVLANDMISVAFKRWLQRQQIQTFIVCNQF